MFISFAIFASILSVDADSVVINSSNGVNVRDLPSTDGTKLFALSNNATATLVDSTLYTGTGCSDGWYKISYNDITGYVCSTYVTVKTSSDYVTGEYYAWVNTSSYVSVKSGMGYGYTTLDKLITGTQLTIISKYFEGTGCDDGWYYVSYNNGNSKGYVCGTYIAEIDERVLYESDYTDEEKIFASELLALGFDETYLPYLMNLHRDYPDWSFVPINNDISWDDLIDGEEYKNKIESTTTTFLDYYIISGTSGTEGGNWYYTNNAVNAYFMDPRNFLTEELIFIFEGLSYNEDYHTSDMVKSMFGSSYLSSDEYVSYFMEAASTYNVSPLHLASRVIKEGGSTSTYGPITGTYDDEYDGCNLYGYYNYYNIGANSSWTEGLYYAAGTNCDSSSTDSYGRPWTSAYDAIMGGAEFISTNYVGGGQNTLYFQKFNTSVSPYFTGQYMTNIMAPTQEGETIYNTLADYDLLDSGYTFFIPVYEDMPSSVVLPSTYNNDTSLSSIKIDGTLIENFDSDVLEYNYYVTSDTTKITLSATATYSGSTLSYDSSVSITSDYQTVNILVTAESGDIVSYIINIIMVEGVTSVDDILGSLSVKVSGDLMSNISSGTSYNELLTNIKKADPYSTVEFTTNSGTTISTLTTNIVTGSTITITSANGESEKYYLVVTGDSNGDGEVTILDLLRVQKHILGSSVLSSYYLKGCDTNGDGEVNILDLLRVQKYILGEVSF